MFKSAKTIRTEAIARILSVRSDFSTIDGEPQVDIIDTMSIETAKLFFFSDYLEKLTSISGLLSIVNDETYKATLAQALGLSYTSLTLGATLGVPSDLANDAEAILFYDINRLAGNYGLTRKDAEYAVGIERFYINGSVLMSIPIGTKVRVTGSTVLSFSTTTPITSTLPAVEPTTGYYYIDVSIRCDSPGAVGNVAANTIQSIGTPIANVTRVTNPGGTSGGKVRESNTDLLNRILAARSAICIDTIQGYESWAKAQAGVSDAIAIGSGDTLMTRAPAGAVDVWVIAQSPLTMAVSTLCEGTGQKFVLPFQPVISVLSVVGNIVYSEGGGYNVFLDSTGGFAGSVRANSGVEFLAGGPGVGEYVTITFVYDNGVKQLQDLLTDPSLDVPGSDVLIKRAVQWFVISQMHVVPLPGYTQVDAESAVSSALTAFMAAFKLGNQVDYSDFLVVAATATIGGVVVVDRIEGLVIGRDLEPTPVPTPTLSTSNLPANENEYYSLGETIFV